MSTTAFPTSCPATPDSHGEAALVLVESLIHQLIEQSMMTHQQALHAVKIATETQIELTLERGEPPFPVPLGIRLLSQIAASLEIDSDRI